MKFEGDFLDPEAVDKSDLPKPVYEEVRADLNNEREISDRLKKLWVEFSFKGNPPKNGSPVEKRLFDTCDRYINLVINQEVARLSASEPSRRELHNQIALMITGKQRTTMSTEQAEKIADFACRFSKGFPLSEAMEN